IAPLIAFVGVTDTGALDDALRRLAGGAYDWLAVTSATTVDALGDALGTLPPTTRVAAVGPATAAALQAHGVDVQLMPGHDHSAVGLLAEWTDTVGRVLLPQ